MGTSTSPILVVLAALAVLFAVLAVCVSTIYVPVWGLMGIMTVFGLLGAVLAMAAIRQGERGALRLFLVLTGVSAAAMPVFGSLHNFILELPFFVLAVVVLPATFLIGWAASAVLMARRGGPLARAASWVTGLIIVAGVGSGLVTFMLPEPDGYDVHSGLVGPVEKPVEHLTVTVDVEPSLAPTFAASFEHSLIAALASNGVCAVVRAPLGEAAASCGDASADATMRLRITPLVRPRLDGRDAIVGTVFDVRLTDATTGQEAWNAHGTVDYLARRFAAQPGYSAHDGVRKEFAWHTTAAIVRSFMSDVQGRPSATIYTATEDRERHGQRTD